MKLLKIALSVNAVLLSLATLVLPAAALGAKLENIHHLWSTPGMRDLTLRLFWGPVTMLALSLLLLVMTLSGRRIPPWLVLIGLLGAAFTSTLPPGISHDFSHVIFLSCSNIYGQVVFLLCMGLGACLLFLGDFQWKSMVRRFHAWRLGKALDEASADSRRD